MTQLQETQKLLLWMLDEIEVQNGWEDDARQYRERITIGEAIISALMEAGVPNIERKYVEPYLRIAFDIGTCFQMAKAEKKAGPEFIAPTP